MVEVTQAQQGRDEATAEIVAWLRHGLSATWPPRSRDEIADAIERGEHVKVPHPHK